MVNFLGYKRVHMHESLGHVKMLHVKAPFKLLIKKNLQVKQLNTQVFYKKGKSFNQFC